MSLFLNKRFYQVACIIIALFCLGFAIKPIYWLAMALVMVWIGALLYDAFLLFGHKNKAEADRQCIERFSNGDENEVTITVTNPYPFTVDVEIIDELPIEFQIRDNIYHTKIGANDSHTFSYMITPSHRGVYRFDNIRLYFSTRIGLLQRRFICGKARTIKVYPSYIHLSQYAFQAIHQHLNEYGIKRVRRIGDNTEFDQIKDYVVGDEYRRINWKASARANTLKVNVFQQERSQDIYVLVDKGRMMQQSFRGLTFLEHGINAALALAYVAIKKEDRAGLITYSNECDTFVPSSSRNGQMQRLMENLYAQQTLAMESDYTSLVQTIRNKITKRSLLILIANFSTVNALNRELPYLLQINSRHKLVIVVFKDREMDEFAAKEPSTLLDFYQQGLVEHYCYEKNLLVNILHKNGINTVYTYPENLSVNVINKYMELRRF